MLDTSNVIYVAGPEIDVEQLKSAASDGMQPLWLSRRNVNIGWVAERRNATIAVPDMLARWRTAQPVLVPGAVKQELAAWGANIERSLQLMKKVARGEYCADIFKRAPYAASLSPDFNFVSSIHNEFDPQEITTLEYDAKKQGKIVAENLWIKISWLSHERNDTSLRFRFSFGHEGYEDVAADEARQRWAAKLTEAIFPECAIVSENLTVKQLLQNIIAAPGVNFVERIIYFNAPNGGAQFHQDVERGHAGVIFAQLHGRTAWLALSKNELLDEIIYFLNRPDIEKSFGGGMPLANTREELSLVLEDRNNDVLDGLLNRTPEFIKQLIANGHAYILQPGDVILLPQHDRENCTWHSVYCLDHHPGQALSFAIKAADQAEEGL